ncbi:hypothetical protein Tco_0637866 [Tanacetum coccineum]
MRTLFKQKPIQKCTIATDDEFITSFSTPVQDQGETSSRHVDSSNMHTFYQHHPSAQRWTKDHPLEQVIGNPSQSVRTRRQLETNGEMCMFALTVSRTEPKNIKEAMADSAWIESMQEELHQFDRLDVWELVDRPLCKNVINLKFLCKNKLMMKILSFVTNLVFGQGDMLKRKGIDSKNPLHLFAPLECSTNVHCLCCTQIILQCTKWTVKNSHFLFTEPLKEKCTVNQQMVFVDHNQPDKLPSQESIIWS